ncbi:hypothetical protein [Stratiformator vulcanicus]|uniref:Uncharacterized protein n=1 Tax=Stratiformator vulcanicus TaxID=2527980 RepID=A0A517R286_9PLAN|nr:hypothetical protein [Stratiformator vulcanicus]QDT37971.1 hypothetical protein Pan189_23550 [Stratiformator vulcanicus]
MSADHQTLARRYYWSLTFITFVGIPAIFVFGAGLVWIIGASFPMARWLALAHGEQSPGQYMPPTKYVLQTIRLIVGLGLGIGIGASIAGYILATVIATVLELITEIGFSEIVYNFGFLTPILWLVLYFIGIRGFAERITGRMFATPRKT